MSDSIFLETAQLPMAKEQTVIIPNDYIKVDFSSLGKLSAPKQVHIKDYTYNNAINMSLSSEEDVLFSIIQSLRDCIFEKDFDPLDLSEPELEELMMNLYFNFWGKQIEKSYELDDDEIAYLEENNPARLQDILEGKELLSVFLTASQIDTKSLPDEFKEPIKVKDKNGRVIKFRLPRIRDYWNAKNYSEDKYSSQKQKFVKLEKILSYNKKIENSDSSLPLKPYSQKELNDYEAYQKNKTSDFFMVSQSQLIVSIDDVVNDSLEKGIELYSQVSLTTWTVLNTHLENFKFGIVKDIEVKSPVTGKTVTRGYPFQFMDFLPTGVASDSDGYTISFGD